MDRNRVIVAITLSLVVLVSWPILSRYLAPQPVEEPIPIQETSEQRSAEHSQPAQPATVPVPPSKKSEAPSPTDSQQQSSAQATQSTARELIIIAQYERVTSTHHAPVATSRLRR